MENNTHNSESWRFDNSRADRSSAPERRSASDIRAQRESVQEFPSYRTEEDEMQSDRRQDPMKPADSETKTLLDILVIGAGVLAALVVGYIVFILFF